MKPTKTGLHISQEQWAQMEDDADRRSPEEACGFVIGIEDHAFGIVPVTNILHDPFRFQMDPQEELAAFVHADKSGEEIIAVYHSHPQGIDHPSASDVKELTFPGIIYLIWYQVSSKWSCRAYVMSGDIGYYEIPVLISENLEQ